MPLIQTREFATPKGRAEAQFLPVSLQSVLTNTTPGFGLYLDPGNGQPLVLYCDRSIKFTEQARSRLAHYNVQNLYVDVSEQGAYLAYIEEHFETVLDDPLIDPPAKAQLIYSTGQEVAHQVIVPRIEREDVARGKRFVGNSVTFMGLDAGTLQLFLRYIPDNYDLYTHSLDVMMYSVALAQRAGYRHPAILREIANGAFLHDLGKTRIPRSILESDKPLSREAAELVMRHPQVGFEFLSRTNALGEIALDIVRSHHERMDGSGYPDGVGGDYISPYARIVAIADVFDAMTTMRPFQPARSSFSALRLMRDEMRFELDMKLFKSFVAMLAAPQRGMRIRKEG